MENKPRGNPFRYYLVGTQMFITVLFCVFVGLEVDKLLNLPNHIATLILSVFSIFYCLYRLIQDVNK